jgi:glucose/arabinose dehydrogenase
MLRPRRAFACLYVVAVVVAAGAIAALVQSSSAQGASLPPHFAEQVVWSGLNTPTNIEFAPDGRVFVAEKSGVIKVFDNVNDPTPTVFADLSRNVHPLHDRGLLGLAIHPEFPVQPYIYVLYTYDAPPGYSAPYWNDNCDAVGGVVAGRCVVTAQLSRLQAAGNVMTGTEQVLLRDWCQQYPSHSIGDVHFGADGMLYVTGGDGASYELVDYGQNFNNPCQDPPGEGGALRSQDMRTLGDATQLNGTVLRLDPLTGAAAPGNPNIGSPDPNARRIVSYGLRNPFRFAMRPGTNEVWLTEVGWNDVEEVNRVPTNSVGNYGWPCYEGPGRQAGYDSANLALCESLYSQGTGAVRAPYFSYRHDQFVVASGDCPIEYGTSTTGIAFYPSSGGSYPAEYHGAMFWADYVRGCIWAMPATGPGGLPDPAARRVFVSGASTPVDLAIGPDGDLYYVDVMGSVRRIRYFAGNQPPVAVIDASPTSGGAPLAVSFNGSRSMDADPGDQATLRYEWDFNGDGIVDSTAVAPTHTYPTGVYTARLTVRDSFGATGQETVLVQSGNGAPTAFVDTPAAGYTWRVGERITVTGHATDPQQGTIPAASLSWRVDLHHCETPGNCHVHTLQEFTGASGSFIAPDHEYPSYVDLVLTAGDEQNLRHTVSRKLDPRTVNLTFTTKPPGLQVAVGSAAQATPFTRTVIEGSTTSVSAVTPQLFAGNPYVYVRWNDGATRTRQVTATASATYSVTYARQCLARIRC